MVARGITPVKALYPSLPRSGDEELDASERELHVQLRCKKTGKVPASELGVSVQRVDMWSA